MCKGCNQVFNAIAMKDGLCEACYVKENGISINQSSAEENEITDTSKPMSDGVKFALIGISTLLVIGTGAFIYSGTTNPPENIVKNIASQYTYARESSIEIVSSYEKEGKNVQVLKVNNQICEMPMLKTNSEWVATEISCH